MSEKGQAARNRGGMDLMTASRIDGERGADVSNADGRFDVPMGVIEHKRAS